MNLSDIRKEIDRIDTEILQLFAERMKQAVNVAHYKKTHNLAQFQAEREKQLLEKKREIGKELGLRPDTVEKLFRLFIEESHFVQSPILAITESTQDISIFQLPKLQYQEKILDINLDIFDVFTRIYANFDTFFFLESLGQDKDFSRFSYLGFGPKMLIQARGNILWIDGKEQDCDGNPWEFLKKHFPQNLLEASQEFKGGLVGYSSFEAYRYQEKKIDAFADNEDFYDFEFGLYLEGLKYNLQTGEISYFTLDKDNSEKIFDVLNEPVNVSPLKVQEKGSNMTDEDYENIVQELRQEIVKGNVFQIVPSRKFFFKIEGATLDIYKHLREKNPSPHMFFLKFDDRQLIGSSPELVARVENGMVESYPIAGTRSRGKTEEEDKQLEEELVNDEKEVAEHMMLVDMARDDLGRVCEYASIQVDKLKVVKKFSHVQHIVSYVSGKLRDDKNMFDAVMTSFPMGTVSGAPRIEAVKLLHEKEKLERGPYSGFAGFFSFSGEAIAALSIRSLFISGKKAYTQAGAGVVYDSIPKYEREEVDKKSMAIKAALGL